MIHVEFCATYDKNDPLKGAKPHGDSHRKNQTPLSHLCTKKICPCEGHNRIYCASDSTAIVDELPMITILLNGVMRQGELGDVG